MKSRVEDLALFGGPPAFREKLAVGRPNIGDRARFLERVEAILDSRWLTNEGPFVQELERRIAEMAGVKHCISVCNATLGLQLLVRAAGLSGEVLVPAFTFVATAHALEWEGVTPVFCDVDAATHNLDPHGLEAHITPRTTGILAVHLWGRVCDVEAIEEIARRHRLALLFDAAHALGCTRGGRPVGGFGLAEVFSFHATKFVNSFEGGAVVTNDDTLAARLRLMKNFGFADYDRVVALGTNAKMSEVSAAMALTSLESLDDFVDANRRNHGAYGRAVEDLRGVSLLRYDESEKSNYQYVVLEIDAERAGLSRDELQRVLWAENVLARRYFHPGCHAMEPYASRPASERPVVPATEELARRVLCLPTGTAVGEAEIATIGSILRTALANADAVRLG
jgi:dTDP-4-amino-4,6-dideoxygalactose transaminase